MRKAQCNKERTRKPWNCRNILQSIFKSIENVFQRYQTLISIFSILNDVTTNQMFQVSSNCYNIAVEKKIIKLRTGMGLKC